MIKLSIEEKAKAYDEAIKRLEDIETGKCQKTFVFTEGLFDYIFPELKESEDERVRNKLIEFFKGYSPDKEWWGNITQEDILAWLEKQGEQKPANWLQELEDKLANATSKQLAEWKEKYFKEKSTEWSEEDEDILNTIINHFKIDIECTDEDDIVRWLKSFKDRVQPQPKQEWSEEDDEMLNLITARLHSHPNIDLEEYSKEYDWLNYRLKYLRPQSQWKPSDEQIECLSDAIEHYNSLGYPATRLKELLDDLKKLREE